MSDYANEMGAYVKERVDRAAKDVPSYGRVVLEVLGNLSQK